MVAPDHHRRAPLPHGPPVAREERLVADAPGDLRVARRVGLEVGKLDLLTAWRDASCYSPRERAALAWAEHVTATPTAAPPEETTAAISAAFDERERVHLTIAIANINAWNRIAGALHFPPAG